MGFARAIANRSDSSRPETRRELYALDYLRQCDRVSGPHLLVHSAGHLQGRRLFVVLVAFEGQCKNFAMLLI